MLTKAVFTTGAQILITILLIINAENSCATFVHFCLEDLWWIENSNEQRLFEIEIFCNIINVFTVTCDHLNASKLNKTIHLLAPERQKICFNFDKKPFLSSESAY